MKLNTAAARTMDIISFMSEMKKGVTLAEISHYCDIPKSSALDLVYTLQEKKIIQLDDVQFKTYKLTPRLFQLGASVLNMDLQSAAEKTLHKLAERTSSTVFLAIPSNDKVIYIKKFEGAVTVQSACAVGSTNPMYITGIGKAMLATYSDEEVLRILGEGPYERRTERSITTYQDLIHELREIRARGYAIDDRESIELLYCFAAPIYDNAGHMVAAISNVNMYNELTEQHFREYPQMVMKAAMEISGQLGCMKSSTY